MRTADREAAERPVAVSGSLTAALVVAGLEKGWFMIPSSGSVWARAAALRYGDGVRDGSIAVVPPGAEPGFAFTWWAPPQRFVIPNGEARLNKNLRRLLRNNNWHSTINQVFGTVLLECRQDREPRWITDEYVEIAGELHRQGWAYSVELWDGDELIAGLFGFAIGRMVSVESLFHRRTDASKICMVDGARRSSEAGALLCDLQRPIEHGRQVGARSVPADLLYATLGDRAPLILPGDRRPMTWLLCPDPSAGQ